MLIRRGFARCVALVPMLSLASCSGPSDTWIANGTGQNLTITYAVSTEFNSNVANGSPWFWPWRTEPIVTPYTGHKLTAYCYGCQPGWRLRFYIATCDLSFEVPRPPDALEVSPEWELMRAYNDDALMLGDDWKLYRIPTYDGGSVNFELIAQPEGYPLSPTTMSCKRPTDAPSGSRQP